LLDTEAPNDYPLKALSEKLAPSLPASHLDLVTSTLEVFSFLAAFSEANSTSVSKLSKIFGLPLLTARQVEDKDRLSVQMGVYRPYICWNISSLPELGMLPVSSSILIWDLFPTCRDQSTNPRQTS